MRCTNRRLKATFSATCEKKNISHREAKQVTTPTGEALGSETEKRNLFLNPFFLTRAPQRTLAVTGHQVNSEITIQPKAE